MTILKMDGDPIGATVTFSYKGPASYFNVGVIVEAGPGNEIYMMKEYYCVSSADWKSHSVSVSGIFNSGVLQHDRRIDCVKVIYASGVAPQPAGNGALIKNSDTEVYCVVKASEFQSLLATYT